MPHNPRPWYLLSVNLTLDHSTEAEASREKLEAPDQATPSGANFQIFFDGGCKRIFISLTKSKSISAIIPYLKMHLAKNSVAIPQEGKTIFTITWYAEKRPTN